MWVVMRFAELENKHSEPEKVSSWHMISNCRYRKVPKFFSLPGSGRVSDAIAQRVEALQQERDRQRDARRLKTGWSSRRARSIAGLRAHPRRCRVGKCTRHLAAGSAPCRARCRRRLSDLDALPVAASALVRRNGGRSGPLRSGTTGWWCARTISRPALPPGARCRRWRRPANGLPAPGRRKTPNSAASSNSRITPSRSAPSCSPGGIGVGRFDGRMFEVRRFGPHGRFN